MPATKALKTSRGAYHLQLIGSSPTAEHQHEFTLTLAHAAGLERVSLRCTISDALLVGRKWSTPEQILESLTTWLEAHFEQIREAALRAARSEQRLFDLRFDQAEPGPFA